jgi:arylsulfatase A-like enzyme
MLHTFFFAAEKLRSFRTTICRPGKSLLPLVLLTILWPAVSQAALSPSAAKKPPNIIVIFADDWGYGDLGVQGVLKDISTPNLDRLAKSGVLCSNGYVTAPQCSPSRAGLLTGRYQQRFGFDAIPDGPLPLEEITIAERLKHAGYSTGMVGKWHLEPNQTSRRWADQYHPEFKRLPNGEVQIPYKSQEEFYPAHQGFDLFYQGELQQYWANYDFESRDLKPDGQSVKHREFRVDTQTSAALGFIKRQQDNPFFLYLAYYAPHVPLEATQKYLDRFPGEMPERRRTALAMISAVDDGVGRILDLLEERGLTQHTLIFFSSDNGAPLGAQQGQPMADVLPVNKPGPAWDGSLNTPLKGEKGMLSEGGIRLPFLISWPGTVPAGLTYAEAVSTLDIAATVNALAGLPHDNKLDGVDLLPYLTGTKLGPPHTDLYWKFWNQAAIRSGKWKFIQFGKHSSHLYEIEADREESHDVLEKNPEVAAALKKKLSAWCDQMHPSGLPGEELNAQEKKWHQFYFGRE